MTNSHLRKQARTIWQAAVDAVRPRRLIRDAFADPALNLQQILKKAPRILVVGGGKAGAAMAAAVEEVFADSLDRLDGLVNVPQGAASATRKIALHVARPAGSNQPTRDGVEGADRVLNLVSNAGPEDVALCLISGGGSALLPAPAGDVPLEDKQAITRLLHECGATINEMNAVRKHLSRIKGGRLAQAFTGRYLITLIISDVIGDPLDVIASGPTAPDSTTFADAWSILEKYQLLGVAPNSVKNHIKAGIQGDVAETPKQIGPGVSNFILGNNAKALQAARAKAQDLGYNVLNLGSYIEGETREAAIVLAGLVRSVQNDGQPLAPPVCILSGGETTVTLSDRHGLGGRNQEMALAMLHKVGQASCPPFHNTVLLCAGTDGEDGPTDAAGAFADQAVWRQAQGQDLEAADFLARNDAYHFFEKTGGLFKTGLTQTNVMDVRVFLIEV